jgi:hypothetical protein
VSLARYGMRPRRIRDPMRFLSSGRRLMTDSFGSILLKVRQAKPGGVGSHVKENATENF